MPTTVGILFIASAVFLFFFWIYGIVSFYVDLRYRFLPFVARKLRERRERRPDPQYF